MAFVTDNRGKGRDAHIADGSVILTSAGKPVECHLCVLNHYSNKCPRRGNSDTQVKKDEQPGTASTASAPGKASVCVTIGEE